MKTVLNNLNLLQSSIGTVTALSWVNCAIGMVNCGVSVVGFKLTLDRLHDVSNQIRQISSKIDTEIYRSLKREFSEFFMIVNNDMDILDKYDLSNQAEMTLNQHITSVIAYLEEIIERFNTHEIDRNFGSNVIFSLSIGFTQIVKEYAAQYYYKNGKLPPNYNRWMELMEKICSNKFRQDFKQYLLFETDTTMEQKYVAFDGAMLAIESKLEDLDFHLELIHQLTLDQYRNTDQLLLDQIHNHNVIDMGEMVYIPISDVKI